jgi:hypothetical protein
MQWWPRGFLPAVIALRGAHEVRRLAPRLAATAGERIEPVGPGGLAATRKTPE